MEREALLAELLPWEHPNYGTDEGWISGIPIRDRSLRGRNLH